MGRKPKSNSLISNLKFYRQNSGFTQQQVADALHIERTTCKTLPNLITLKKLAQIYHVSVDDLMPMEPEVQDEVCDSDFSSLQRDENPQQAAVRKQNNEKIYCLGNDEQSLIINYRILPKEAKQEIIQEIQKLTEKYKDIEI